ncbi:MAG: SAM-dependent methyltransferase, partial [Pseudomonadota bacterium]
MRPGRGQLTHAVAALAELLRFSRPADQALSSYLRHHRGLGQRDRAFVAETAFAALRRKRSLEAAAGSATPHDLVIAALVRVFGLSGRVLEADAELVARIKGFSMQSLGEAQRADLPDWLWERLVAEQGAPEAARIALAMLNPAPLDLRVNLARGSREEILKQLDLEASPTPYSPAGIRLQGKPAINRHPLYLDGSVEVQDEGSQLLAYLVAARRGGRGGDI